MLDAICFFSGFFSLLFQSYVQQLFHLGYRRLEVVVLH